MKIRIVALFPALMALTLPLLSGCGRNVSAPTAVPTNAEGRITPLVQADGWEDGVLLAVIEPGASIQDVSGDHDCTVEDGLGDMVSYRLVVPQGTNLLAREAELAADPRVAGVSRNYFAQNSEARQSSMAFDEGNQVPEAFHDQEAFKRIGLERAIAVARANGSLPGRGPLVAIIDTGAFLNHRELRGRIDPASYDFVSEDNVPLDRPDGLDNDGDGLTDEATGHGTHVAGLMAAVSPDSRLMILRVLNSDGVGTAYDVARAIEYAATHGARVINLSLGMLQEVWMVYEALKFAEDRNCVVIASAGNWGASYPDEYPASSNRVLAIAASDSLDRAASFTSYSNDVALSAPGTGIRSAFWNGGYAIWSGTSMSAPLVAGGAALLLQLHPNWTREQVLARLAATVDPVIATDPHQVGRLGAGRLNLGAALTPEWVGQSQDEQAGLFKLKGK